MLLKAGKVETVHEAKQIEWRIPFFSPTQDFGYESPSFSTPDHLWKVRLCQGLGGIILIDICTSMKREYSLDYSFGLKRYDGSIEKKISGILEGDVDCPWIPFIENSELLQRKTEFMPDNSLTITCSCKRMTKIPHSAESTGLDKIKLLNLTRLDKLSADFKDLFENKESCDVILKVQDREYKAHKSVLMARSSVFAANFKHDTLERQTGVITIPDCDPDSFHIFLEYLYCGKLKELSFPNTLNLYYTSDKYDVGEPKAFCVEYLMHSLTVDNICEVAVFSDKYNEMQLFSAVQDFFNKNFRRILDTCEWECLMQKNYRLTNKLLKEMSRVKFKN